MATNKEPIYTGLPKVNWNPAAITAANTAKDGTGTVATVFTADAVDGSFVERLRIMSLGTNVATVLRVFINNGATNVTPANNVLWDSMTLPATTNSEVAALQTFELPLNFALAPGYKINVVIGTAIAAGVMCTVIGGDY